MKGWTFLKTYVMSPTLASSAKQNISAGNNVVLAELRPVGEQHWLHSAALFERTPTFHFNTNL